MNNRKSNSQLMALVLGVVVISLIAIGIYYIVGGGQSVEPTTTEPTTETTTTTTLQTETTTVSSAVTGVSTEDLEQLKASIDVQKIKPNELGEVMVLMYHRLAEANTEYDRTVESFKADLERLYKMGFRSISMADYMNGTIDIPAGTTPIIFTFDDGDISHFKVVKDASGNLKPDPNCVVGILDAFREKYPDFGRHGIFYVNAGAFHEPEYLEWKLKYLLDNGYEVGNHTFGHENLSELDADGVEIAIGKNAKYYSTLHPNLHMDSLALPFGIHPQTNLISYAMKGNYDGYGYQNRVLLLVGWKPTYPIYLKGIDPEGIHRVQCGDMEMQLTWWLDNYEQDGSSRFISDGVKEIITIPESWAPDLNPEYKDLTKVYIYSDK